MPVSWVLSHVSEYMLFMSIKKLHEFLMLMKIFSFDYVCAKLNQDLKFHARYSQVLGVNQRSQ